MKHIVKKIIALSLALLFLLPALAFGVSATTANADDDTTIGDTTIEDSVTDDTTTDDTTGDNSAEDSGSAEATPEEDSFAKYWAMFLRFFAWFTRQVNKFFTLI